MRLLCGFALLVSATTIAVRADEYSTSEIADSGLLIVDGQVLSRPYRIGMNDSGVTVNGQDVELKFELGGGDRRGGFRGEDFPPDVRGGGRGDRGNYGGRGGGPGGRGGRGRGGPNSFNASFQKPAFVDTGLESNQGDRSFRRLVEALTTDSIVVTFTDQPTSVLTLLSHKNAFCESVINRQLDDESLATLGEVIPGLTSNLKVNENWERLIREVRLTDSQEGWARSQVDEYTASEDSNYRQIAAVRILERSAYPLTLVGMVLGAFALGHTLKWSAKDAEGPDAVGFMKIALLLICAMSLLDLVWTGLNAAAGQMKELNPMALGFVDSPVALILFKLIVTGGACGILYRLREQPKAQFAAWWMCLVCVLLTFRWVVFNSLFV